MTDQPNIPPPPPGPPPGWTPPPVPPGPQQGSKRTLWIALSAAGALVLLLLVVLLVVVGGGAQAPFDKPKDAIEAFIDAANNSDAAAICALFGDEDSGEPFEEGSDEFDDCVADVSPVPKDLDLDSDYERSDAPPPYYVVEWERDDDIEIVLVEGDAGWVIGEVDWGVEKEVDFDEPEPEPELTDDERRSLEREEWRDSDEVKRVLEMSGARVVEHVKTLVDWSLSIGNDFDCPNGETPTLEIDGVEESAIAGCERGYDADRDTLVTWVPQVVETELSPDAGGFPTTVKVTLSAPQGPLLSIDTYTTVFGTTEKKTVNYKSVDATVTLDEHGNMQTISIGWWQPGS